MKPSDDRTPDWTRERPRCWWDPSRRLLKAIRDYQNANSRGAVFRKRIAVYRHRFWSVVTQADIPLNANIEGGLILPHPNGVVIHPTAQIGPNCLLFQQVTIGTVEGRSGTPVLEERVDVGAGARILGPVRIGHHARIGANAVVVTDVPAGAIAVGIPARNHFKEGAFDR
ncbi:serine acetyltransferase [uncultured Jannaschia sp.]|uniref:serine O-acetyltransferase n=1 Tax=uncultured Jannaschia sp. TaxID=293347 RepID=UPI002608DEC8|nr:serine acetyltransferase [uncultured Jannaschia sp.]